MARTSTKMKAPKSKKRNAKVSRKQLEQDAVGFLPGVGAVQTIGKYMPGQSQLNKFIGGRNPLQRRNGEDIELLNNRAPELSQGHLDFIDYGSIERYIRDGVIYRAFTSTPVFPDGYRMGAPEGYVTDDPEYQVNPAKFERCVKAVQRRGGANGYAVCTAQGLRNARRRRNPEVESDAVYESFHGVPPTETVEVEERFHVHGHLGGLGDLVSIQIRIMGGTKEGALATIKAPDPNKANENDIVLVSSNEARNQMYLVGGDQDIDLASLGFRESFMVKHDGEEFEATDIRDHMILGEIQKLTYQTEKKFDDFKTIDYFHKLGEDTKIRPFLAYEPLSKHMSVYGGEYSIHDVGLVN